MIAHPHITKIIAVVMAAAVCLCLCAAGFSGRIAAAVGDSGISMEYEAALFGTDSILSVNIRMDEADWNEMLANATAEEYYPCDVEINGTTFYRVGIRPKGNTSLTSIANDPTTDRYSFKLEFDHYVDRQTCFGLDKLILNNNYADATNMKEALIYDMYRYLGADASLYNYAKISVNGEYWGLYLALEAVEDSFLLRNYGAESGALYKPDSMNIGGKGGFSAGGGADLNYTDDDLVSYETIWDGEVTDTKTSDRKRVVAALRNIAEGTALEDSMDIDNLLRYMAVHVFSVNEDSLSGNMAHNYYLYESGGRLNLLPWDYNLALGGMGSGKDATDVVNDAIDNAFSGTTFFDSLMENEAYHSQYYAYLQQLVSEYIEGGGFDAFYERVRSQIDTLVETDPTAFYTYEEYLTAAETLYQVVMLRGQSIQGQLNGTIPSTAEEQKSSDALVDASTLELSAMGYMNGGGGDFSRNMPDTQTGNKAGSDASKPDGTPPEDFDPSQSGGEMPEGFDPSQFGNGSQGASDNAQQPPNGSGADRPGGTPPSGGFSGGTDGGTPPSGGFSGDTDGGTPPSGGFSGDTDGDAPSVSAQGLIGYAIAAAVMAAAFLFAVLYRRNPRRR